MKKQTTKHTPTAEQQAVIDAARAGDDIIAEALAGTGKTTTLALAADALPGTAQYIAFNKAIVADAKKLFPKQKVKCNTAHSLAFQAVGKNYTARMYGPQRMKMTNRDVAQWLGCRNHTAPTRYGDRQIDAPVMAGLAMKTVERFCYSQDRKLATRHVPKVHLVSDRQQDHDALAEAVLPLAKRVWADIRKVDGQLPFDPDHYLKIWQLGNPTINCDTIFFDEAQDANPAMLAVVNGQEESQLVYCGDTFQAIYEWRGAVNALAKVHVDTTLWLTQSFRFGDAIAQEASDLLRRLGTDKLLTGSPAIASKVEALVRPGTILCRTNAGVIEQVLEALSDGRKPAVVGKTGELTRFAEACGQLRAGRRTGHPDLAPFKTWQEVLQWIEEEDNDTNVRTMVRLVEAYGVAPLVEALEACVTEKKADVVISTAHKAKGREWPTVKIAGDFLHRDDMDAEDLRLAYVAVTRAREILDIADWQRVPRKSRSQQEEKPLPKPPPNPAPRKRRKKRPPIK